MVLVLIFPGPHEPNDYMLDQIMEPLIDELLVLQKGEYFAYTLVDLPYTSHVSGVELPVWDSNMQQFNQQLIYVDLLNHITDLVAHIKMCGGAGVAYELNFCLYCRTRLSALSVPMGFQSQSKSFTIIYGYIGLCIRLSILQPQ
jgi:hypothetical protein